MALTPYLLSSLLDDHPMYYQRPSRLLDQHFGMGLFPSDLIESLAVTPQRMLSTNYYRPWRTALSTRDIGSTISNDKDQFKISLDVQQFKPEEISVKALDNENAVVIEGKHEERQDEHGFISRQFSRRYVLPPNHDVKQLTSSLSSDGVLTITAPKVQQAIEGGERSVQIKQSGPVRGEIKEKANK